MSDKKTRPRLTLELKDKVLAHLMSIEDPEPSEIEISREDMVMELKDAIQNLVDRKFTMKQISQFCTDAGFPIPTSSLRTYLCKGQKKTKARKKKTENQDPAPTAPGQAGGEGAQNAGGAQSEKKSAEPAEKPAPATKEQAAKDRGFSSSAIEDKIKISDRI